MVARYGSLAFFLALVVATAFLAGSFEVGAWYYQKLTRPWWTPPGWLFGAAWSLLYVLAALAAWHVWLGGHRARLGALAWWSLVLVLNVVWSALFFGMHRIGWSWLTLAVTILAALLCIRAFRPLSRTGAFLMLPYLLGLSFACLLNIAMWILNGGSLAAIFP